MEDNGYCLIRTVMTTSTAGGLRLTKKPWNQEDSKASVGCGGGI
jgi:hypothetical protein